MNNTRTGCGYYFDSFAFSKLLETYFCKKMKPNKN